MARSEIIAGLQRDLHKAIRGWRRCHRKRDVGLVRKEIRTKGRLRRSTARKRRRRKQTGGNRERCEARLRARTLESLASK